MPILAIDTATVVSSVAVAEENKLLAEITIQTKMTHSETLLPHVEQVLAIAGVAKKDLQAVAVSIGPGSFTGLRIGLATAKAIAYGLGIPVIGVPTAEALAWHYPIAEVAIMPFIDAQKNNVYAAIYYWAAGQCQEVVPIQVYSLEEALALAGQQDRRVLAVGDIAARKLATREELPTNVQVGPAHLLMPRAANVAMAGWQRLQAGQVDSVMDLEPVYIRRSEAEVLWEKRQAALQQVKE